MMDCPAYIEHVTYDTETGAPLTLERLKCTGTLEGPVPNPATGKVESSAMGNDEFGHDWYCSTCGQTTVIVDQTIAE